MDYPIIISPLSEEDGGGFVGMVPDLMGCMSDGETAEEALASTKQAIAEWIETAKRREMEVPLPGSFAERKREEKARFVATMRQIVTGVDAMENRLQELEHIIRDIEDRASHEDSWRRFIELTGVEIIPITETRFIS